MVYDDFRQKKKFGVEITTNLLQIQFFQNHWQGVSNRLRLFIINPSHILKIKITVFS